MSDAADRLVKVLEDADDLLFVTGAGVSLASGIPTFRGTDPGAVWKRSLTEMATLDFFLEDPVESWRWYLSRFETLLEARPNPAHQAIAQLEQWQHSRPESGGSGSNSSDLGNRDFLLITQNIDTLHEQAGSQQMVKVHGSSDRVRCPSRGCPMAAPRGSLPRPDETLRSFLADPSPERLPQCPECAAPLRPHVLWFDEYYNEHDDYQWPRVQAAAATADAVVFVGTSFSVGVTDLIAQAADARNIPILSIDPGAERPPYRAIEPITEPAEELLPKVVERLTSS